MTFWLHRFRKLDVRQKSHRKMLIDTFVNAIFLYDDKMVITFNYKDGTSTITFDDLNAALAKQNTGSDLDCSGAPKKTAPLGVPSFLVRRFAPRVFHIPGGDSHPLLDPPHAKRSAGSIPCETRNEFQRCRAPAAASSPRTSTAPAAPELPFSPLRRSACTAKTSDDPPRSGKTASPGKRGRFFA